MQDWTLVRNVLELRYSKALALWDSAGKISDSIISKWPALTITDAAPTLVHFGDSLAGIKFEMGFEQSKAVFFMNRCSKNKMFDFCQSVFPHTLEQLGVKSLNRVGNRLTYHNKTASAEKAFEHIGKTEIGASFAEIFLNKEDPALNAKQTTEFTGRFEDANTGVTITLKHIQVKINFEGDATPPPNVPHSYFDDQHYVEADTDIYTKVSVPTKVLDVEQLLKSNIKKLETRFLPKL